jgi:hypothetical protein
MFRKPYPQYTIAEWVSDKGSTIEHADIFVAEYEKAKHNEYNILQLFPCAQYP